MRAAGVHAPPADHYPQVLLFGSIPDCDEEQRDAALPGRIAGEKLFGVGLILAGGIVAGGPVGLGISALTLIAGGYSFTKDAEDFVQAYTNWQAQKAIASDLWNKLEDWSYYP